MEHTRTHNLCSVLNACFIIHVLYGSCCKLCYSSPEMWMLFRIRISTLFKPNAICELHNIVHIYGNWKTWKSCRMSYGLYCTIKINAWMRTHFGCCRVRKIENNKNCETGMNRIGHNICSSHVFESEAVKSNTHTDLHIHIHTKW